MLWRSPRKSTSELLGWSRHALPFSNRRGHPSEAVYARRKRPIQAVLGQVRITRDGNDAIIEYADSKISDTRLTIGPQIKKMTDKDIVDIFNGVMAAQEKLLADWDRTVSEISPGRPQIELRKDIDQLVPLAEVLRCCVDDGGPDGEVTIHIDDRELSLAEFGQLIKYYAGWGMRVTFVPEERVTENPVPALKHPKKPRKR
jgi:hypothetical protein